MLVCTSYLDTKRNAFPRFFFISDDELLSVLGNSDPTSIQEHMLKLFDNCASLTFGDKNKTVIGMKSAEGETYAYRLKVSTEGAVEVWMKFVEMEMRHTLFEIMKEGTYYYAKSIRTDWITDNLGMVTLVGYTAFRKTSLLVLNGISKCSFVSNDVIYK